MPKIASRRMASRVLTASRARCVRAWDRASMRANACEYRACLRASTPPHTQTHTHAHARAHTHNFKMFIYLFIHSSIHPSIHPCIHPCIHAFIHPSIHSFIRSFIHAFIRSFIHSYIHTCIHSSSLRAGGREQIRARGSVQGRRSARQTQGNCPLCRVARRRYLHPTSTLPTPYFPPSYTLLLPFHHPTFRLPTLYFHRTYTLHSSTNCRLELAPPIRKPLLH